MTLETRTLSQPLEFRAGDTGKKLAGTAIVYNRETIIGDYFRERIMPGAFAKSLTGDVRALYNHDSAAILGRTAAKTLRLAKNGEEVIGEADAVNPVIGDEPRKVSPDPKA